MPKVRSLPALLALVLGVAPARAQAPPGVTKIACVGEHSTDSGRVDNALEYPARLQVLLGEGYQVAEFGFGTASLTTTQFGTAVYADSPEYAESVSFDPDIVIVGPWGRGDAVGTVHIDNGPNDNVHLYQDPTPLSGAAFQSALGNLVATYQQLPGKPIVLVALPLPFPYGSSEGHVAALILPITQELAVAHQLPTVDLWTPFIGHADEFEDADHLLPSPGMQHMAEVVLVAVQALEAAPNSGGSAGAVNSGGSAGADSGGGMAGGSGGDAGTLAIGGGSTLGGSSGASPAQDPGPGVDATGPSSTATGNTTSARDGCSAGRAVATPPALLVGWLVALLGIVPRRRPLWTQSSAHPRYGRSLGHQAGTARL